MTTTRERTFLFCQTMTPSAAEGVSLCTLILAPEPHPPAGRTTTSRHGSYRMVSAFDRSFGQRTGPRNQTQCVGGTLLAVASLFIVAGGGWPGGSCFLEFCTELLLGN